MKKYRVYETVTYVHYVSANNEEQAIDEVMLSGSQGKLLDGADFYVEQGE
jgi:hypothetical protein|tara:strand:+ start:574 stop:723 length:150 start_codon:yes stop_codon:yes gene_type:complete